VSHNILPHKVFSHGLHRLVFLGYTSQVRAQQNVAGLDWTMWTLSRGWPEWRPTNW